MKMQHHLCFAFVYIQGAYLIRLIVLLGPLDLNYYWLFILFVCFNAYNIFNPATPNPYIKKSCIFFKYPRAEKKKIKNSLLMSYYKEPHGCK